MMATQGKTLPEEQKYLNASLRHTKIYNHLKIGGNTVVEVIRRYLMSHSTTQITPWRELYLGNLSQVL